MTSASTQILRKSHGSVRWQAVFPPLPGRKRPAAPVRQIRRLYNIILIRCLVKIMDLERHIDVEVVRLVDLKRQIRTVIEELPDRDEQTVLRYRCLLNYTFEKIGDLMCADRTTAFRWYCKALTHVKVPENPIVI